MSSDDINEFDQLSTQEAKAQAFISELYQIILGRNPDTEGLRSKMSVLLSGKLTPGEMVRTFFDSPEGKSCIFSKIWDTRTTIYHLDNQDIETDLDTVQKLFNKTANYWRTVGFDKKEVYFSVLSSSGWKRELSEYDILRFYRSGTSFIDFCIDHLKEQGVHSLENATCLDFGCGVGRLSFFASKYFKEVYAVDFSKGHLELLKENMGRFPSLHNGNIACVHLKNLLDIRTLPKNVDFVYSFISLQHNTPPVIAFIIKELLGTLKRGGYACLHIPIHHPFYRFSEKDYLDSENSGNTMEMHILPRENIRNISKQAGASMIDSFGYGGTKGIYSEVFFFQK